MRKAFVLTTAVVFAAFADVGVKAADAPTRISGPHVHENLAVYFIHGPSTPGPVPLTLAEALAKGAVKVIETGNVNALKVENLGQEAVFIQSGDIVKGGQQDRVLTVSLLLPKGSGQVAIDSFCVEAGRWAARGKEDVKQFASAAYALPSREAKLAMKIPSPPPSNVEPTPRQSAGVVGTIGQRRNVGGPGGNETADKQRKVWDEVARIQDGLSGSVGARVAAPQSATSLQLSLENETLKQARDTYTAAFEKLPAGQDDVVGFVFAIDGRINSADVYPSHGLFEKMWSKLLTASITEAVGAKGRKSRSVDAAAATSIKVPDVAAIETFLKEAEGGKVHEQAIGGLMKQDTREAATALFVEARSTSAKTGFVHRNYLAKCSEWSHCVPRQRRIVGIRTLGGAKQFGVAHLHVETLGREARQGECRFAIHNPLGHGPPGAG